MHKPTLLFAVLMILLGVGAYFLTGRESMTAMIPAFIGVPVAVCGIAAAKARKPALIAAIVLGVLGALGPLGRIIPAAARGEFEFNTAVGVQIVFIALAIAMVVTLIAAVRKPSA